MSFMLRLIIISSKLIPRKFMENNIKEWLKYAGAKDDEVLWAGKRMFLALLVFAISALLPLTFHSAINLFEIEILIPETVRLLLMPVLGIAGFFLTLIVFYLHLLYVIDGRKRLVEKILPDFLYLVGNNLKSGMTPFYAFRTAARPEFGPLNDEMSLAAKKSLGTSSFSEALKNIGERINSKVLIDTTKFFAHAISSGGKLAQLVETTAENIKQTQQLKKDLVNSTRMYIVFILFVVIIASPMLLAVSVQFLGILESVQNRTSEFQGSSAPEGAITMSTEMEVTPEFMETVSYAIIIGNSFLAGIFMGVIGGGKVRDGLKFFPMLLICAFILFRIFLVMIGGVVGGLA